MSRKVFLFIIIISSLLLLVSETDIHHEPAWDLYVVTTYSPFTPPIYITVAHDLTGPWSEPACIYDVPEHELVSFDIWSYAVRPHPEFSTAPGELVISYATNSVGTIAPLLTPEGLQIYAPKFIRAQIEPNELLGVSGWLYF